MRFPHVIKQLPDKEQQGARSSLIIVILGNRSNGYFHCLRATTTVCEQRRGFATGVTVNQYTIHYLITQQHECALLPFNFVLVLRKYRNSEKRLQLVLIVSHVLA
jgi:hypothetical protein